MTINKLAIESHKNAVKRGAYDAPVHVVNELFNVIGEVVEAAQAQIDGNYAKDTGIAQSMATLAALRDGSRVKVIDADLENNFISTYERTVKNTLQDELADIIINTLSICKELEIDIDNFIELKTAYNSLRGD
jgi:NTP pyrophosphatase (non-canonical NTP hydrolase)